MQGARTSRPQKSERNARDSSQHKFWHSRGYLPHCDTPGLLQSITFRLADALPADALQRMLQETTETDIGHNIDMLLDAGHGACWLKQAQIADIVENALLHWDGQRYHLLAWCIMPNHVHLLIETREGWPLPQLLQSWKSYTAKAINHHLGRIGTVWMADYFDRYIRDDMHLAAVVEYIHDNPVKAGLVNKEQDWMHSSARFRSADVSSAVAGKMPALQIADEMPALLDLLKRIPP